jgi:hypothetical protein
MLERKGLKMTIKKAACRGGVEQHDSASYYTKKNNRPHQSWNLILERIEAGLKSSIIWFPTHDLMPIVVAEWLIRFFQLEHS